ncbi:MAG: glycosyltransferase family 4 protein [Phycisphaerales bacterium]|nr:glycosyltransferase family 4 protein [Phycisphaerales bacterium]MCB9857722.1 glycosyltransferase family 4 protein [Phycisphaerales bacterium]MCB9863782.1 glycosyltransferase family 4 protein [Phycisphaerales bacterium]
MSAARHILFINEFYYPDICASSAVLSDRLPRIKRLRPDWKVSVIAGNRAWDNPTVVYPSSELHEGVDIVRVVRPIVRRKSLVQRAVGFAAFQHRAVRAGRRLDRVDCVVATTAPPQGAAIARKIAGMHKCPYVYCVLDLYPDLAATLGKVREGSFVFRRWLKSDTWLMCDAARVISIAEEMTKRIGRTRSVAVEKLGTIHDGFDPARIAPPTPDAPNRFAAEHNPEGRFVVQYAGNMGLSHPFDSILEAAIRLGGHRDIQFQFIGDGPHRKMIEERLPSNAKLIDYVPASRLWEVLHAADLCLISQQSDMYDKALPYKVYGILAAAKPAIFIGNERSEIARWLTEHDAGMSVRQEDPDALVDAIKSLKSDPAVATRMGCNGRALLEAHLLAQQAAESWIAEIEGVISP